MLHVPFVCQRDHQYPDYSCGVACAMMALRFQGLDQGISYAKLCDDFRVSVDATQKGYPKGEPFGTYPEDVHRCFIKNGWRYRVHFYPEEWGQALTVAPIAVLMGRGGRIGGSDGHWVLLVGLKDRSFVYLDPMGDETKGTHIAEVAWSDFYKEWTGIAFQLLGKS